MPALRTEQPSYRKYKFLVSARSSSVTSDHLFLKIVKKKRLIILSSSIENQTFPFSGGLLHLITQLGILINQ